MLNLHGKPNAAEFPCQTYIGNQTLLCSHAKLTWETKRCWITLSNLHGKPNAAEFPCQTYMGNQTLLSSHERCRFHNVHTKEKPALLSAGLSKSLSYEIKSKNSSLVMRPK